MRAKPGDKQATTSSPDPGHFLGRCALHKYLLFTLYAVSYTPSPSLLRFVFNTARCPHIMPPQPQAPSPQHPLPIFQAAGSSVLTADVLSAKRERHDRIPNANAKCRSDTAAHVWWLVGWMMARHQRRSRQEQETVGREYCAHCCSAERRKSPRPMPS
jgi:hypothetical protein